MAIHHHIPPHAAATRRRTLFGAMWAAVVLWLSLLSVRAAAQTATHRPAPTDSTFAVESFRMLSKDVTAFIDTVCDNNHVPCALVKVVAPTDFAFSTPLGIVKRRDEVGEILLYMPAGSKQLTLKHPQWGVLRDYKFGTRLESRMTYELRVRLPMARVVEKHDTVVYTQTVVDTVTVAPPKRVVPIHAYTLLTAALHTDGPSWGVMAALMWRHGVYVHASSSLKAAPATNGSCERDGSMAGVGEKPYFTGQTKTADYAVTAGMIHRLGNHLNLFESIGYANHTVAWQLANSEGGGWLRNDGLSRKGVAAELGVVASAGKVSFSLSALTIAGKQWQGCIGIGIRLGKARVVTKRK